MSNPRKSIKPSKRDFHDIGTAINAISWPATSSMTTHCGSFEPLALETRDRKSTRLNSSHLGISYAVFCLKKKNNRDRSSGAETFSQFIIDSIKLHRSLQHHGSKAT